MDLKSVGVIHVKNQSDNEIKYHNFFGIKYINQGKITDIKK